MNSAAASALLLVRRGMVYLEEAVLTVLREAEHPLRPAEIAEQAGLFCNRTKGRKTNCLTQGILDKLEAEGQVRCGWSQPDERGIRVWEIAP